MIALGATIISIFFALSVFLQFARRRKLHQLLWSVGLLMFSVAALCEFLAEMWSWSVDLYKLYYAMSPSLVGMLGAGSVFFLSIRGGRVFAVYVVVLFFIFVAIVSTATVDDSVLHSESIVAGKAMPSYVRAFSPLFTVPGSIALIGISLYSWYKTKMAFTLLITAGAAVNALGGILARYEIAALLYFSELLGISLMYLGFIRSLEPLKLRAVTITA